MINEDLCHWQKFDLIKIILKSTFFLMFYIKDNGFIINVYSIIYKGKH